MTPCSVAFSLGIVVVVVIVNAILLAAANTDGGMGAMAIAVVVGPITNAVLFGAAIACTPVVRRVNDGQITLHVLAALMPILAIGVDALIILRTTTGLAGS